ncbi:MAG: metallophosphoesterase [Desulfovibrionaceae bacterium]|jgi:3',5'-cyclic AMP phosphodiesterase CpdA|nr:metallophosphoesterase [Desulfovibrionaceae bacterium]
MKDRISRRTFLKAGSLAAAAGTLNLLSGATAFAASGPRDFGTVKFAVIADPHVDIKGKNGMKMSAASLECVQRTVTALNTTPDMRFVMVCGDLLLDGERENAHAIKKELDQLKAPYFVVAGNHDFAPADTTKHRSGFNYLTIEDFVQFFTGHGYDASGKRYYAAEVTPGLRIIGLDANLPLEKTKWGAIMPEEQLAWLDSELAAHKDALHVVFMHHNLIRWTADELPGGPKQWFTLDNADRVREVLSKHAATAPVVIAAHRHIALNLKELNGVNYFASPSVNSHPMRYTVYDIDRSGISWQTPAVPVDTGLHLQARENLLAATWWRPTEFSERNPVADMEVLSVYENNGLRMGRKNIKA